MIKFGEAMKDDGTLDNNERKELMDEYMGFKCGRSHEAP